MLMSHEQVCGPSRRLQGGGEPGAYVACCLVLGFITMMNNIVVGGRPGAGAARGRGGGST